MKTSIILQVIFFSLLLFENAFAYNGSIPLYHRCLSKNHEKGLCVHIKDCDSVMEQVNSGTIHLNPPTVCSHAEKTICCPIEGLKKNFDETSTNSIQESVTEEISTFETLPPSEISIKIVQKKCREHGNILIDVNHITPILGEEPTESKFNKCKHNAVGLVIGGTGANLNEFPHQALLGYKKNNNDTEYNCGGSLISSKFVLTAAHCLDINPIVVKLGMHERLEHSNRTIEINIAKNHFHPNYHRTSKSMRADIGLVELQDSVQTNEYILPICLPSTEPGIEEAIVSGFGNTEDGTLSDVLMKVSLERYDHAECQSEWKTVSIDKNSMLCYGHHTLKKDSCKGDSGSPIQRSNNEEVNCTYTQLGIVSFGRRECGLPKVPGVYTNVYYYLNWIVGIVWKDELE